MKLKRFFLYTLVLLILFYITGCGEKRGPLIREKIKVGKVLILPVRGVSCIKNSLKTVYSPYSKKVFKCGVFPRDVSRQLTIEIVKYLSQHSFHVFILPGKARLAGIRSENRFYSIKEVIKIGKRVSADTVLITHLFRFRERKGRSYSVVEPAAISFEMALIEVKSGRIIWKRYFEEEQTSLSQNLFKASQFFHRGVRWLTAMELARYGLENVLSSFP